MSKIIPERMCVCCRKMFPKSELIRICNVGGETQIDLSDDKDGRGAYVCSKVCLASSRKGRRLERALRGNVSENLYEKIGELLDGK